MGKIKKNKQIFLLYCKTHYLQYSVFQHKNNNHSMFIKITKPAS